MDWGCAFVVMRSHHGRLWVSGLLIAGEDVGEGEEGCGDKRVLRVMSIAFKCSSLEYDYFFVCFGVN